MEQTLQERHMPAALEESLHVSLLPLKEEWRSGSLPVITRRSVHNGPISPSPTPSAAYQ